MTFLYGLGLTLTLLMALGLIGHWLPAMAMLLLVSVGATAGAVDRRIGWAAGGLGVIVALMWLIAGGAGALGEVLKALELHISGLPTALPFVAGDAALIGGLLCALAACFVTQRSAGPYPALVLLLLIVVLLWLFNMTAALWCLLPAVIASVALMLLGDHDISAARVLPLAAVVVALSYTAVAVGGATIPAFKDAADSLRQRIYDIFFFTGSREEFSLADVGYYPQGEGQLGGPAEPSETPLMAVITPRRVYLRGVLRNEYTGRAWQDTTGGKRYLWDSLRYRELRDVTFDAALPAVSDPAFGQLLTQRRIIVRMLDGSASTLFVPQRVRRLSAEGELVTYFNAGSEIFTTRNLVQNDVWEVDATVFEAGEAGLDRLIALCADAEDPNWDAVNRAYRALPAHYYEATAEEYARLEEIVFTAIAGADTPYETALALQYHLQSSYRYTLDAPEQSPDHDFVCSFILYDKVGYCTHYASAMTIMCRMAGLPARYVEGFVATPETEGEMAGMAIVTGKQGHAWTEVYFRGVGWVTFDATPAGADVIYVTPDQLTAPEDSGDTATPPPTATPIPTATPAPAENSPSPSPEPVTPTPEPEPEDTPDPESEADALPADPPKPPFPWWLIPAIALPLAVLVRILWMTPGLQAQRKKSEFGRWLVWAQAAHDALRRLGLERKADETPMAFFARVDATNTIPRVLSELSGAESLMFYGHADPLPEETAQAKRSFEVIAGQLTGWQKLAMHLQRAFLFRRSRDITVK